MKNPYASKEESNALIKKDSRTDFEKDHDALIDKQWGNEQGAEPRQRTWLDLKNEDGTKVFESLPNDIEGFSKIIGLLDFSKDTEAKLKDKNGIATEANPVCNHIVYSVEIATGAGNCLACGAEGRMRFVVDEAVPHGGEA